MTTHTPGPWKAIKRIGRQNEIVQADKLTGCQPIAVLSVLIPEYGGHEASDANARLICAAPELLAAAEALIDALGPTWDASPFASQASRATKTLIDAIAKAKG